MSNLSTVSLSLWLLFASCFSAAAAQDVPQAGTPAPGFSLPDQHGTPVTLDRFRGRWVVLYFYPKADTPGCTEEACKFRDDLAQLTRLGAQILGVSVDDTQAQSAFAEKYHLPFPLLSDHDGKVAASYGAISDWGIVSFAKRYTFLIDEKGTVRKSYLSVDTSRHSTEIIEDLERMRHE